MDNETMIRMDSDRAKFLLASVVGFAMIVGPGAVMSATASPDTDERRRYAIETAELSTKAFIDRKRDFQEHKCRYAPWDLAKREACDKPAPYDSFDWDDDGCSGRGEGPFDVGTPVSNVYRDLFNEPCQQHDFGYRNLGRGLSLQRTEDRRQAIDVHFVNELNHICAQNFGQIWRLANRGACHAEALAMYYWVRNGEDWRKPCEPGKCHGPATSAGKTTENPGTDVVGGPSTGGDTPAGGGPEHQTEPGLAPGQTWTEKSGSNGSPTFQNVTNASGQGQTIPPMTNVQVSCKIKPASTIGSASPDGYWYRIATAPWNNNYYAVANTFWNGDVPGQKPYTHNTDFAVADC